MKVNALFLRAKYRDYYDLYFLSKSINIKKIYEHSLDIVEGVTFKLFVVALLYIDDLEDDDIAYLEPIEKLSKKEIRDYFQKELSK